MAKATNKKKEFNRIAFVFLIILASFYSCEKDPLDEPQNQFYFKTNQLLPVNNINNWWKFTELNGNHLSMFVADTVSDQNVDYYKIIFQEENLEVLTDWYKISENGIFYSTQLTGNYRLLLPSELSSRSGTVNLGTESINYEFLDSLIYKGFVIDSVVRINCSESYFHGFDEIVLANKIGILKLLDQGGRIPFEYSLDSVLIGNSKVLFE